jgi:hypothetical protein
MAQVFAPGCALLIYKPELAKRLLAFLNQGAEDIPAHATCCRHDPALPAGTRLVNEPDAWHAQIQAFIDQH